MNSNCLQKKFSGSTLFLILLLSFSHVLLASQMQEWKSNFQVNERSEAGEGVNRSIVGTQPVDPFLSFVAWCVRHLWELVVLTVLVLVYLLLTRRKTPVEPADPLYKNSFVQAIGKITSEALAFCSRHKWKLSISLMLIGLICVVRCYVVPRLVFPGQYLLDLPASNYLGNPSATNITNVTTESGPRHVLINSEEERFSTEIQKVILWFGGNAEVNTSPNTIDSRAEFLETFCPACDVLLAGRPGYGGSAGSPSEKANYAAAVEAFDWLINQGYSPSNIYVGGFSMGNTEAIYLASKNPDIAGLLCFAPFTSLPAVVQVKCSTIIFYGTNDPIIPLSDGKDLATTSCNANPSCNSPDEIFFSIDGATHRNLIRKMESGLNASDDHPSYRAARALQDFFSD